MTLRRPKIFNRINPVDTGGITSGRSTTVSTTLLKGHSLRAKNHASAIPNGRIRSVLASPTAIEKRVICQVSKEEITKQQGSSHQSNTTKPNFLKLSFAAGLERWFMKSRAASFCFDSFTTATG